MGRLDWDENDEPIELPAPTPPQGSYALLKCKAINFNTDSAVPPPDAIDVVGQALLYAKEHPNERLLLLSHTDRVASDDYNEALSADRAANVFNLLTYRRDDWATKCNERHRPIDCDQLLIWADKNMGGADDEAWGCAPDAVSKPSEKTLKMGTKKAIARFFRRYVAAFGSKPVQPATAAEQATEAANMGNQPPEEFWKRIFMLYHRRIQAFTRLSSRDQETIRKGLKFASPGEPSRGCGEKYPLERPDQDNFESETNRRTELMFFTDPRAVPWDDLGALYLPERFSVTPIPCPVIPSNTVELKAPPGSVVFLLDISGSMKASHGGSTRLACLKQSVKAVLQAKQGSADEFAIVTFASGVAVYESGALQKCTGDKISAAIAWVNQLQANGNTNTSAGFQRAAQLAGQGWTVIFVSDGLPSAGTTNPTLLKRLVSDLTKAKSLKVDAYGFVGDADLELGALMKSFASAPPSTYWHPISTR